MLKLHGIFPPIATPFNHEGEIYRAKVEHNVSRWNRTDLAGYVVSGSTGESVYLTAAEKLQLFELVAKFAAAEKTLIAGTGVEGVRETVQLTNQAAELGYKAAMVRTPHYYRNLIHTPESQLVYYRAVADQAKIPLMIYNWPQITGYDIPVDVVAQLSQHPNIIAIKESSGNLDKVKQLIASVKPGFQVLVGSAPTLADSLALGAVGAVLAYANAAPYSVITIWEAHRQRDYAAAQDWQQRIQHAAECVTVKYGIPGLKYAMDLKGYFGGPVRLPLVPVSPAARQEIEAAFDGIQG